MLKIDQYSLNRFLGKGTFGEVYLTQKEGSLNYYATKRMEKKMVDDPRYKKYFNNEISILKRLFHENIIRLEDLKVTLNHYYIIMEYCNGGSLNQCLNRYKEKYHRPFTEEIVQYIMRQVISAVKYIHAQNIIHRDLKLDNILVNFSNQADYDSINMLKTRVKLIDFGFASSKDENEMYSTAIGSPLNMDPLILKKFNAGRVQTNDLYYDEKADIWSLGALCYQMLIGNSPFDAYNMQELIAKIEEGTYKVPTNLSREVVSFLNGMLQYDPKKRLTAENLSNHAFLTKNVSDFTRINTNMISRNVYGGQLNINIKNNQSIWAIFNEDDQNMLNNIPGNIYSSDVPLSESRYMPTTDNFVGITPEPHNELRSYFDQTQSVPIVPNNGTQNNSSLSTNMSGGLNPPQMSKKNASEGPFPVPQQPQNQNQFQYQYNQNNPNTMNPQHRQKMASQIITFGNDIFSYNNNQDQSFNSKQDKQEPMSNKEMEQQNQKIYPYRGMNSDDNIQRNIRAMQSPTLKNNQPPQFNKMFPEQNMNYQMVNNNNNQNIVRGKVVNRAQYPPNMGLNRQLSNNQPINQQQHPPLVRIQLPFKQQVQNPGMNQIGNKPNVNMNPNRPGQLNIVQRQPHLSPAPRITTPNMYSNDTVPKNNNINPIAQKKIIVISNPRTPTKGVVNINGGGATNAGQNMIKNVRPIMFRENPQQRNIQRQNSYSNFNIINNQVYANRNMVQNSPNPKIQYNQQNNTTNKKNTRNVIQQPVPKKLVYQVTPQKLPVGQNMNNLRAPGHFVYTQNNVS